MQLKCYTYDGWDMRVRPARSRRSWMDGSPEQFVYRCLPLTIANAHGWEILSPCGFEARWDGSAGVEGVEVRGDPGVPASSLPVALFGQGVLTFHVQGIFRTSPGWNLWVGGSPNDFKDGICPLGALIETDWSPYTFTMNWRFTRANHWIRFEENEPFCFVFPLERGALGSIEPEIVPIGADADLKGEFESWSASRDAFQQWVQETRPAAPSQKWQKLYYRGVRPDGSAGPQDHQSKLRLRPFRKPDGSALETEEATVRAPGNIQEQLGSPPRRPVSGPDTASLHRVDWMLSALDRQRAMAWGDEIERLSGLSGSTFFERYYAPGRPVVLTGEMASWPALERWTSAYLSERVGDAEVEFQDRRTEQGDFELYKDNHKSVAPFRTFIERIEANKGNETYLTAYNSGQNADALAPLREDLGTLPKFLRGEPGMLWIGPMGTFTPLHYDLTNNFIAQIVGEKKVFLLPPGETRLLYNNTHVFSDAHDIMDDERLLQYPLAAGARRYEVNLGAGDILFVPVGWWHQVTALDFSVTLTFTDFLWPNDHYATFPAARMTLFMLFESEIESRGPL